MDQAVKQEDPSHRVLMNESCKSYGHADFEKFNFKNKNSRNNEKHPYYLLLSI